jgi:hypothetical protein
MSKEESGAGYSTKHKERQDHGVVDRRRESLTLRSKQTLRERDHSLVGPRATETRMGNMARTNGRLQVLKMRKSDRLPGDHNGVALAWWPLQEAIVQAWRLNDLQPWCCILCC